MSGEKISTNVAFYQKHTYINYNYYTKVDCGSGNKYWYGSGHAGVVYGKSRSQSFVDNSFSIYLAYRTSDGGTWHDTASASVAEGKSKTIKSQASHSIMLRWRARMYIPGDHVAYLGFYFHTRPMYSITDTLYPQGRGKKVYVMTTFGTNPVFSTGTKITTAHFLVCK